MRRRRFLALLWPVLMSAGPAMAGDFLALAIHELRGDPARLGWSSLRAGFRVWFPAAASGRAFLARRHHVVEAVERALRDARYDPAGGDGQRRRLERLIADTVRRAAPAGTVRRVSDIRIEAR